MKKLIVLTALFSIFILGAGNIYAQKKAKLELNDVVVPTVLKLGGDEIGFKVVFKNVGEITSGDDWEAPVAVKVYINGTELAAEEFTIRLPKIEAGDTYEKEYTVQAREKFRGERIKIEVSTNKLGSMTKEIGLEK